MTACGASRSPMPTGMSLPSFGSATSRATSLQLKCDPLGRRPDSRDYMREYLQSRWVRVGLGLFILGCGPLILIIVAAAIGLWPDPNPNPIGPGLLFFFTFWPAAICIIVGGVRVRARNR